MADGRSWNLEELHAELARFEALLVQKRKAPTTVRTYVTRSETFLRFLAGTYESRDP